jgi:ribonucleoside-diphosphate reductase alpha chain
MDRTEKKVQVAVEGGQARTETHAAELSSGFDSEQMISVETQSTERTGMTFVRRYTTPGKNPFDQIEWEKRDAVIADFNGDVLFEQKNVEVPASWSVMATNVVVQKYFRGGIGMDNRETSVKQLIGRVADTITDWGYQEGSFATENDAKIFHDELTHMLVNQVMAFNSPVWFNVGAEENPQCSACFINSVEDTMESILGLAKTEGLLFKYGSGTGTNLSPLRSSKETLSSGGSASGPVSFMKGYDAFAGVIKSGGKTRRAAKMVMLDVDHPDIEEFINCKVLEEKKAWALIDQGYDGSFNGEAYGSVFFQNSNNSVRVTDEFMQAVADDKSWTTHAVSDGRPIETYKARELMRQISEGTYVCGDPGMQYDTTVNDWHTCSNTDRIHGSNPCSEYMFLNNSACNLASLNLMKFVGDDGEFEVDSFRHAVDITLTAMEILIGNSSYPRPEITENSLKFRPLGLGYANLGALLMNRGLPYDSEEGRHYAAAVTSMMCGQAYLSSARMAENFGAFEGYDENREPMLNVIQKHKSYVQDISTQYVPSDMLEAADDTWNEAYSVGEEFGYRNAQVTVLAPTGTIGFMMDCDTTGIEPDIALIKYKKLVGGGVFKIVNKTVPVALNRLGYAPEEIKSIMEYVDENETIEGAPELKEEHLPIFDCAFKPAKGERTIDYLGHIRMMGATQPFLSGAISKTVNMPTDATVEQITEAYMEAWKQGLKAVAIYRDGSKRTQPLNTSAEKEETPALTRQAPPTPQRVRLPDERQALTHKFSIGGHEGYITVGLYPSGQPGEMFIAMAKEGSVVSGLMDSFATACSIMLQYGVPVDVLIRKFSHSRFEPSGFTTNPEIPTAKSIMDYLFRWMELKFGTNGTVGRAASTDFETGLDSGPLMADPPETRITMDEPDNRGQAFRVESDAPPCPECGSVMVRNGACHKCLNCAATSGCS